MPPLFPHVPPPRLDPMLDTKSFYADVVYERIQENIQAILDSSGEDEQLTVFVCLDGGGRIVVESFGYHNPSFIIAFGVDNVSGNEVQAFISHTNIQVLISRSKKQPQAPQRRIGFRGPTNEERE